MGITLHVGHSKGEDAFETAKAAAQEALADSAQPRLGIVFATSLSDLEALVRGLSEAFGDVPFLGCSSAGEFVTDRISDGGVAVSVLGGDGFGLSLGSAKGLKGNTTRAVAQLRRSLRNGETVPAPADAQHHTVLLLCDGLAGNGEGLVDALAMEAGPGVAIAGGAAGDDAKFAKTRVFANGEILDDAVVAAELITAKKVGVGVHHGWCAASAPGTVTDAEGSRLIAIDDQPAIEFYRAYAQTKGVELTAENQNEFVFTHELGIVLMNDELKVRAPLSVNDDGSINCATEVPKGQQVRVVEGDHDAIIAAAKTAAEVALEDLGEQPSGAIVFDCVARKLVLGARFDEEVAAFREVLKAPLIGFNTYGEIARVRGQLSGFHNTTAVVVALPQ